MLQFKEFLVKDLFYDTGQTLKPLASAEFFLCRQNSFANSCLHLWATKPFLNRVYCWRKEFAPTGANSFLQELTFISKAVRFM